MTHQKQTKLRTEFLEVKESTREKNNIFLLLIIFSHIVGFSEQHFTILPEKKFNISISQIRAF
jgi:hypothetical protein